MEQIGEDIHENNWFRFELIIIAIHSFVVGSILILLPSDLMRRFGVGDASISFYSVQSGVMLYILAIGNIMVLYKFLFGFQ